MIPIASCLENPPIPSNTHRRLVSAGCLSKPRGPRKKPRDSVISELSSWSPLLSVDRVPPSLLAVVGYKNTSHPFLFSLFTTFPCFSILTELCKHSFTSADLEKSSAIPTLHNPFKVRKISFLPFDLLAPAPAPALALLDLPNLARQKR